MPLMIGTTVLYRLTEKNAEDVNRRYADASNERERMRDERPGFQAHVGNRVATGEIVPLIITKVWDEDRVNGQAILDGNDSLWITTAEHGRAPGNWDYQYSSSVLKEATAARA